MFRVSFSSKLHSGIRLIVFCAPNTIWATTDKFIRDCFFTCYFKMSQLVLKIPLEENERLYLRFKKAVRLASALRGIRVWKRSSGEVQIINVNIQMALNNTKFSQYSVIKYEVWSHTLRRLGQLKIRKFSGQPIGCSLLRRHFWARHAIFFKECLRTRLDWEPRVIR